MIKKKRFKKPKKTHAKKMFSKLVAGATLAIAIARPIKESESFSAWKEEVSLNFRRRQNVILFSPSSTPIPLSLSLSLSFLFSVSLAYLVPSLKVLRKPFLQMLKKQRHITHMESQHGQQV